MAPASRRLTIESGRRGEAHEGDRQTRYQAALETTAVLDAANPAALHAEIYNIRKRLLGGRVVFNYLQSDVPEALRDEVMRLARKAV